MLDVCDDRVNLGQLSRQVGRTHVLLLSNVAIQHVVHVRLGQTDVLSGLLSQTMGLPFLFGRLRFFFM